MNNKTSFINSGVTKFWIKNEKYHPFNYWVQEENLDKLNNFFGEDKYVKINIRERSIRKDYDIVKLKQEKYCKILHKRLNNLHNVDYSKTFWEKTLSTGFIKTISYLYDSFVRYENEFDFKSHSFKFLSSECFYRSRKFEDLNGFLSKNDWTNEQLFSIYLNCFYEPDQGLEIKTSMSNNTSKLNFDVLKHKIKRKLYILKKRLEKKHYHTTKTAILGSYFSKKSLLNLIERSNNEINEMNSYWEIECPNKSFDQKSRTILFQKEDNFDRIDHFIFTCLYYLFPNFLVESFSYNHLKLKKELSRYINLKTIICENWIGQTKNSLLLAVAKECFDIKHISNEHNCFFHIYEGNYTEYFVELSDKYITLGWTPKGEKIIKGGSLYPFKLEKAKKEIQVLFVSGPLFYKKPFFSTHFSNYGDTSINSINFNKTFFKNLDKSIVSKISYLGYPINKISSLGLIQKEKYQGSYDLKTVTGSARKLMPKSDLIIIDYVGTSFIESLVSNIPTVVFFDSRTKFLSKEHQLFFDTLINVKIFHTTPSSAASHVNKISNDPSAWWNSKELQKVKDTFLRKNLNLENLSDIIVNINDH